MTQTAYDPAFNDLIHRIYKAAMAPEEWNDLLPRLADYFRAVVGASVEQNLQTGQARVLNALGFDEKAGEEYSSYYGPRSVAFRDFSIYNEGSVVHDQLLSDYKAYRASETFDFFRQHQGEHVMTSITERKNGWMSYLAIRRPGSTGSFTSDEIELAGLLLPHLIQANRIARQFQHSSLLQQTFSRAYDHLMAGIVIVQNPDRMIYANSAAERIFQRDDGISLRQERLRCREDRDQQALQQQLQCSFRVLRQPDAARHCSLLKVSRGKGEPAYQLSIIPLVNGTAAITESVELALVTLHDPQTGPETGIQQLADYYGLTVTEALVTGYLCQGKAVALIARQLEITDNAVRFHLKNIFQKLHVRSQTELVSLVLRGPLALISHI